MGGTDRPESTGHIRPPTRRYAPAGHFALKAGAQVRVRHGANTYPLPPGLEAGACVKIISFDHGHYTVENDGRTFSVFITNIIQPWMCFACMICRRFSQGIQRSGPVVR